MSFSGWAVVAALVFGSIRALQLLRASCRVEVVNAVVITTLAAGRGEELPSLLSSSGRAIYLTVARSISMPVEKLVALDEAEARPRLERDAQVALMTANRTLKAFAWLDGLSLAAVILAGVGAVTLDPPSAMVALGLVAATLLWLSNAYRARSIATRMFAGAMALVDGLVLGREQIRSANGRGRAPADGPATPSSA